MLAGWLAAQVRVAFSPERQVSTFISDRAAHKGSIHCGLENVAVQELCPQVSLAWRGFLAHALWPAIQRVLTLDVGLRIIEECIYVPLIPRETSQMREVWCSGSCI